MATKIQVLADPTYQQYIMMGIIQASRNINQESNDTPGGDKRKSFARSILSNPSGYIGVFASLVVVSFDTSTWEVLTEAQKVSGATTLCSQCFNEAANIYP